MEEDDMDFTPSPNTSSNLASLFGLNKKPLQGNPTLTYTAPKAPKKENSPSKNQSSEDKNLKSVIIISKAVQAYKLENRAYASQGITGLAISGKHDSRVYEIILYKPSKECISKSIISKNFLLTLSPNNYASFYDNNKQNWSVMFQTPEDVEQFATKVAICKFYNQESLDNILIQDLTPSFSTPKIDFNSTVNVIHNSYKITSVDNFKISENTEESIKLSSCDFPPFAKGLIGCEEKTKRVIIVPHALAGSWKKQLQPNTDLLLEVKIVKIITEADIIQKPKVAEDNLESPVDSSAEESSIKARGVSIKEALSNTKSQKANLISRMAKMGQATLPLKQDLTSGMSDSEEEIMTKPQMPRSRAAMANAHQSKFHLPSQNQKQDSQQLSVYKNEVAMWQQSQLDKVDVAYKQLIPVSVSPVTSPTTDPNFSVYVAESRVQSAKLKMKISKVSDKLDLVWNKLQNLDFSGAENKTHQPALMDSSGILTSIQNLISENENLKAKVEEQKGKIEQQNDRVFQLLELNHKYLEQNSSSHEKQSVNEFKLKEELETLRKKEIQSEESNKASLEKIKNLESSLSNSEEEKKSLRKKIEELNEDLERHKKNIEGSDDVKRKEIEGLEEKMSKAVEAIGKLKERLREVLAENENLKTVISDQRNEIEAGREVVKDFKIKNEEYEKEVDALKKQMSAIKVKSESKIEDLSKMVAKLEEENKNLRLLAEKKDNKEGEKEVALKIISTLKNNFSEDKEYSGSNVLLIVEQIAQKNDNSKEEKEILLKIISKLNNYFSEDSEYTGSNVLHIMEKLIEETEGVTIPNKTIPRVAESKEEKPKPVIKEEKAPVVPAPRTSIQNSEIPNKEPKDPQPELNETFHTPEQQKLEEEKKTNESSAEKKENDSRYKSYDQGWRTTKPPPPPLFDDEDDDDDWLN